MKKFVYNSVAIAITMTATVSFASCSQDEDILADALITEAASRSVQDVEGTAYTIGFEKNLSDGAYLAQPTSYGENLYASYTGDYRFTTGYEEFGPEGNKNKMHFGINYLDSAYNFWNGGIARSNWAINKNPRGETDDWWYSYLNQCSVFNDDARGDQSYAGHKSETFAILYGYQDFYNESFTNLAQFSFDKPITVEGLYYCNSSYVYGVITNGNTFGNQGVASALYPDGYFKVIMNFYNENDSLIAKEEQYLAKYNDGDSINPVTKWTPWMFEEPVRKVKTVKFNFEGSDVDSVYGLITPAYLCIDDIHVRY